MSCLIRKPPDQCLFPTPRSISLVIASFFAFKCLGIPYKLLIFLNFFLCGDKRTRTADICLAKAALYQLSYTPTLDHLNSRWTLSIKFMLKNLFWAILDLNQGPHPYQGCALTI